MSRNQLRRQTRNREFLTSARRVRVGIAQARQIEGKPMGVFFMDGWPATAAMASTTLFCDRVPIYRQ